MRHASLWILTFVTLLKAFLSQPRGKVSTSFTSKSQEFCWWARLLPVPPAPRQIQEPVRTFQPHVQDAIRPSLPAHGAYPAAFCMLILASHCIRRAIPVSQQQHLVFWQALVDNERLISILQSSVSCAVLLIQSIFFCV